MAEQTIDQIHVSALCGSLRENSYTAAALRIALDGARQFGATTEFIDLRDYDLPLHAGVSNSEDAVTLKQIAKASDALILGTPEYHGSFSGVLKNALDFLTFDEMEGKMIGLVGVSGGAMGAFDALNGLRSVGRALHAWVLPQQATVPEAFKVFDDTGRIRDPELERRLRSVGIEAARYAHLHKCGRLREFLQIWETAPVNPGGASASASESDQS